MDTVEHDRFSVRNDVKCLYSAAAITQMRELTVAFVAKSSSQKSGAASVGRKTRPFPSGREAIAACTNANGR